jgi:hypothetical protein
MSVTIGVQLVHTVVNMINMIEESAGYLFTQIFVLCDLS